MNRSRRQELLQLVNKKRSFLSPPTKRTSNNKPFRRQSCRCSECGHVGAFQDRQNALHPQTYIRAHHCKKRKRRMQRRKGTYVIVFHSYTLSTSTSLNIGDSQNNTIIIANNQKSRKTKSILVSSKSSEAIAKCKRLLTKDDQQINYEFFYNNELKYSKSIMEISQNSQTYETALISFVNLTKSPSFAFNSFKNIINESRTSSSDEQNQKVSESKPIQSKTPLIKTKNISMHNRKLTEGIMLTNVNKTVQQFVSSCTSMKVINTPKPQKQIQLPQINLKKEQNKFSVYLLSSPRKALFEMKTQITSQKKIKTSKK